MSKRLQVVLDDSEYRDLERWARRQRTTVSAVVRRAIRELRQSEPTREPQRKLQVVREAARHAYPAPEIAQVLAEIERGYGGEKEQ
ncbi:MAG: ribbon-helix-helix protein, CopG family [Gemmatimonadaceae bacterium]